MVQCSHLWLFCAFYRYESAGSTVETRPLPRSFSQYSAMRKSEAGGVRRNTLLLEGSTFRCLLTHDDDERQAERVRLVHHLVCPLGRHAFCAQKVCECSWRENQQHRQAPLKAPMHFRSVFTT